jgi:hypothetical protein
MSNKSPHIPAYEEEIGAHDKTRDQDILTVGTSS